MEAIITKTDVYKFDELPEESKQFAIEKFRENNLDYEWYEFTYEDARECGKQIGIDIDKIYFSGFWSQGDGACFEGSYSYAKRGLQAIKYHAPKETELHRIALELQKIQRKNFYRLEASVKHSGHYYHEMCTDITVDENYYGNYIGGEAEEIVIELLRDFMCWIYKSLENEYDYLQSDEQIIETIECNEYNFTLDGEIHS